MAGPRPDDPYNPVPTVSANTQAPNDYLNVRANPNSFGAQIGESQIKLGSDLQGVSEKEAQYVQQRQGMINETLATNGETQANSAYGDIMGKYKSLKGLDAVNAAPQATKDVIAVRQNLLKSMPNPMAAQSFNTLVARQEGYVLRDIGEHAGTQVIYADTASAAASLNMSVSDASDPTIAFDDKQFNDKLANIQYQSARMAEKEGLGDSGPAYQEYAQKNVGQAWYNRLETIAKDPNHGNPLKAADMLEANKDKIPSETYAKASAMLYAPVRSAQSRSIASNTLDTWNSEYQKSFSTGQSNPSAVSEDSVAQTVTKVFPGAIVTSQFRTPEKNAEVNGVSDSMHLTGQGLDFVAPKGTTLQEVRDGLYLQGFKPTEILDEGTHFHVGWAPKGNVGTGTQVTQGGYQSQADFYNQHYSDIIQDIRDKAQQFNSDPTFVDEAVSRGTQKINEVISQQAHNDRADQDSVLQAVNGKFNNNVPITNVEQLDSGPPDIKASWDRFQMNNPLGAENLKNRIITANSRGASLGYGSGFYQQLNNVLSGKVTDSSSLWGYVGFDKNAPLTNSGLKVLSQLTSQTNSPEAIGFNKALQTFMTQAKSQITGNFQDKTLNDKFEAYMQQTLPMILTERQQGKSVPEMFNPKSPDYVGNSIESFKPQLKDLGNIVSPHISAGSLSGTPAPSKVVHLDAIKDSSEGLKELNTRIKNKQATREQAIQYAQNRGWIQANPPPVPLPGQ